MDLPQIETSKELFRTAQAAEFHAFYKQSNVEGPPGPPWTTWRGYTALKCPLDMWIYQELLSSELIGTVVENGTADGGSTLFLADVCDSLQRGHVIAVDIDKELRRPKHNRITYLVGDTLDKNTVEEVTYWRQQYEHKGNTLLILDDGHSKDHVFQELHTWNGMLQRGDFLIVEDTDLGGPYWGLQAFMKSQPEGSWQLLQWCEKFHMTQNPYGYWRKM